MTRKKIVYVDDLTLHLMTLQARLKQDYDVYPAQSAIALFETLSRMTPDLILLDIQMPEMNGFEILKKLKDDVNYKNIPVIILSSKNDQKSLTEGMKLGAADFITKPYSNEKILDSIAMQLDPVKREANKPLILAVDDNPVILKSINSMLNDLYAVRTLAAPDKLQELLKVMTPDLFLLDYNMPVMNGIDTIQMIRTLPVHADTPVIFITMEGSVDLISVAIHLGSCDFIVKPVNEAILRDKVASHLSDFIIRRRMRSALDNIR